VDGDAAAAATADPALVLETPDSEENDTGQPDSDKTEIDEVNEALMKSLQDQTVPIAFDDNVLNILLIGSDSRTMADWSRSDVMILVSINKNTKEIALTSLMRDIYLYIQGVGYNRLNVAYAYGGPDLLLSTVQESFKVKVDQFVAVNFFSFIKVVDDLGGVDIDVKKAEIDNMNSNIMEVNDYLGDDPYDSLIADEGLQHLNGKQALGYARIRYVGYADFDRTARQRLVLDQLIEKGKKMTLLQLNNVLGDVLPEVMTNMEKGQLISLMLDSLEMRSYKVIENRIPIDGSYKGLMIEGMSVLGIDIDANIQSIRDTIYS
jgi:LCP family protein required for cell wall assembly